ncbi:MBOAT family protein [Romeria aff. gracilis LEGE 07310]|uniref:MBOAT family protein n=1 Tax=Vasconcelosia minhoensis LEGE 07310 TaxID=915328 RepID=A0A8J7A8I5_9CYAN|nr:MBOAT family protein [Romeria gracilis]MBE9078010.1 MBOAT family protein [Romeria aff. gracilis LEGE 07310]
MTLPSVLYSLFLTGVFGLYWLLPTRPLKLWLIVIASLMFYGSLQAQYVPLLGVLVALNFYLGQQLATPLDWRIPNAAWQNARQDWNQQRLRLLQLGVALNVLLLLGFKYLSPTLNMLGFTLPANPAADPADLATGILMPLGLSFFTFECIAYLIDVYRGSPAASSFVQFAAYKLFFPKLISGPITRFHGFTGQLKALHFPRLSQGIEGVWLIAIGAVKKLLIADHLGLLVNLSFDNLARAGSGDLWLATLAYGLQLYFDFSGYVDIARGSALLLGFNLPQNFNFPYFSTSIADFWRRWHMTLGDWLRNYLYFPLGGSRRGIGRTCLNLMLIMLVAGIWHGDRWGFVIWGGLHGLALIAHRLNARLAERWPGLKALWLSLPGMLLAWLLTQTMVFSSWIFFRLPSLSDSGLALQKLWGQAADAQFAQKVYQEAFGLSRPQLLLLILLIMAGMCVAHSIQRGLQLQLSWPVKTLLIPLCFFIAWLLAPTETAPYIYFDF